MEPIIEVKQLKTWFDSGRGRVRAVDGISFDIQRGETLALLGESGCGKSMTALSIMQLLPPQAKGCVEGVVNFENENLLKLSPAKMRALRGRRIAMIFQEPMTSLNPVLTVGRQIEEVLVHHKRMRGQQARQRTLELLDAVGIPERKQRYGEYPHQLSGGMKQRVMIAIALAGDPDLLIADEPTTALDVTIQAQILDLLKELQQENNMALLLITHDLGVVAGMADKVAVMYAGVIVEYAAKSLFFKHPQHPYSQKLFASLPNVNKRNHELAVIAGQVPALSEVFTGCRFAARCDLAWSTCEEVVPNLLAVGEGHWARCHLISEASQRDLAYKKEDCVTQEQSQTDIANQNATHALLQVKDLEIYFAVKKGLFQAKKDFVRAVDGVSFELSKGRTLALVGESGCGKTTVGKGLLQLIPPSSGAVNYDGRDLCRINKTAMRNIRGDLQMIFQDPYSSMNPRMKVGDIIEEGMIAQNKGGNSVQRRARVERLLEQVGLPSTARDLYPHEFSGGQRQRICIARALAVEPKIIICDEPTSALDVSVQAQILNLLKQLQNELGVAYLFITHNMSVVEYLAHDVAVMYLGRIVEHGSVMEVMMTPKHPYTRSLLSAVPVIEVNAERSVIKLAGDMPSPVNPPTGCHFHPRCPEARAECKKDYPEVSRLSKIHQVHCHLY
ncbi:Oligopeptide transport ATP-binding protein OppD (TC 3.A.1.5.1) [hydrothermal vent metagenome]|uniref:Oligopeptide transport ATP-binding protein OppD (TC 3.A.1.5.1) n=1 Tax=hydrothermal vent metagenome TaxID=652676 RepID=A0A3B0YVT3_9ZZZZ